MDALININNCLINGFDALNADMRCEQALEKLTDIISATERDKTRPICKINHSFHIDQIDERVWQWILSMLRDPQSIALGVLADSVIRK